MKTSARIHHVMHIPPPLIFLLAFIAGIGLQHIAPLPVYPESIVKVGYIIGITLVGLGLLLGLSCLGIFLSARTTFLPFGTAKKLVTWGPYRFTRNPMYVSLVITYIGVIGIYALVWPLLLLPLPVIIINKKVIPLEEARLLEVFGDAFQQYCKRARRWI